jgi:sec-independent protein translocase protein TatB
MLNVGFGEIVLIAALLLVVVGPERLPRMLRIAGQYYAKLRRAAQELQVAFMDEGDLLDGRARDRYSGSHPPLRSKPGDPERAGPADPTAALAAARARPPQPAPAAEPPAEPAEAKEPATAPAAADTPPTAEGGAQP